MQDERFAVTNATNGRYRALLEVSSAIAEQPSLDAILGSLRGVLSNIVGFDSVDLYLLSEDDQTLQLIAFDRSPDLPALKLGTTLPGTGTLVDQVIQEQQPVYLADLAQEMVKIPELASLASAIGARSGYVFPVSTSRRRFGALIFGKAQGREFPPEDMELMNSVASHVAVALESALAIDSAERYQRDLVRERDRLRLLLEINNQVVSKLDIDELFRSASASMRASFGSDFTGFWVIDKDSNHIRRMVLDFPGTKGFLAEVETAELRDEDWEKMRARLAMMWSAADVESLPTRIAATLKAEGITAVATAPMVTGSGPLGVLAMGSRRAGHFGQQDLDILSQISGQISLALDNALAYGRLNASAARLEQERLYLESEIRSEYNFEDIVGKSYALRKVLDQIAIVAPTASTVLLHGETGTGKELVARALHSLSPRHGRTFVRLNCAAIPSGLVESELFGHEKGAFTGALIQKRGRFEVADKGTLFLDEIGDISLDLQPKLLRALQEHEFERLGSTRTIQVDVRLIAATHRDLQVMISEGKFREDLFYRLNVFPIEVPPLRERREDIPLLVNYFVTRLSRRMQKRIASIPRQAMDALANAPWPGNIRELENFVERCVILSQDDQLIVPLDELAKSATRRTAMPSSTFHDAERQAIIEALKACSGRISGHSGAAERLGLKRTTLQNKMRKLNITRADYSQ
jgi:formate hydrogenlyase transcriptional activator